MHHFALYNGHYIYLLEVKLDLSNCTRVRGLIALQNTYTQNIRFFLPPPSLTTVHVSRTHEISTSSNTVVIFALLSDVRLRVTCAVWHYTGYAGIAQQSR